MSDLFHLANQMNKLAKRVPEAASENAKGLALHIVKGLAVGTPVDTSEALSNWQVGVGNPKENAIDAHFAGQAGTTQFQSATRTVQIADANLKSKKPGVAIYITNNAPHIEDLNMRGSNGAQSAPPGFIDSIVNLRVGSFVTQWQI